MHDVLNDLCHRWGIEKKMKEYSALSHWPNVVGKKIADISQPLGIERGKLFVQVESAPWRNELTFMKPEIIQRMNHTLGNEVIIDIVFTGKKGASKK